MAINNKKILSGYNNMLLQKLLSFFSDIEKSHITEGEMFESQNDFLVLICFKRIFKIWIHFTQFIHEASTSRF